VLVAAFNDGDVGVERIVARGELGVESLVGVQAQAGNAPLACFEPRHQLRELRVAGGASDQRDVRCGIEDRFAFLLRHAAQHAEFLRLHPSHALAPLRLRGPMFVQAHEDLLRRLLADAASVV
jgi:hypothetical protein